MPYQKKKKKKLTDSISNYYKPKIIGKIGGRATL